jgi:hypothetical protein
MTRKSALLTAFILATVVTAVLILPYLGTAMYGRILGRPTGRAALVGKAVRSEPTEEVFSVPLSVSWEATVMGALEGGQAYAMMREDGSMFYAFFDDAPEAFLSGTYRIQGAWLGTTCAYLRSVFGRCVPEVRIGSVESATVPQPQEVDTYLDN